MLDRLAPRKGFVLLVMAVVVEAATGIAADFFIRLIAFVQIFFYGGADKILPGDVMTILCFSSQIVPEKKFTHHD